MGVHCLADAIMEFWSAVLFLSDANIFSSAGFMPQQATGLVPSASCSLSMASFEYQTVNL